METEILSGGVETLIADNVKAAVLAALNEVNTKAGRGAAYVVESWHSGTSGYVVWSNGQIEQWGRVTSASAWTWSTVTLRKPFSTTDYFVIFGTELIDGGISTNQESNGNAVGAKRTGSFRLKNLGSVDLKGVYWYACGY